MLSKAILLLFVGVALSNRVWQPNKQYEYELYLRTLTALPDLRDQYVGVVTKGQMIIQVKSNNEFIGYFPYLVTSNYHDDLPEPEQTLINPDKLCYVKSSIEGKSFVAKFNDGVIENLYVDENVTNDEANQIKAFLSQLQADVTGVNLINSTYNFLPSDDRAFGLYSVMEPVVTGRCQADYEVGDLPNIIWPSFRAKWAPDHSLNSTDDLFFFRKSYKFSNCLEPKGYYFGLTVDDNIDINGNHIGGVLSNSVDSLVVAMGKPKNFTIKYSTTNEKVFVSAGLVDHHKTSVMSQVQIGLTNFGKIKKDLDRPKNLINIGDLVYTYNIPSDMNNLVREMHQLDSVSTMNAGKKEHNMKKRSTNFETPPEIPFLPHFIGYKGGYVHHSPKINVEEKCIELSYSIAKDVNNQQNIPKSHTLDKYNILTNLVQTMSQQQIENVGNKLFSTVDKKNSNKSDSKKSRRHDDNDNDNNDDDDVNFKYFDQYDIVWQVYRDAVGYAGTGPAVKTIFNWVLNGKVKSPEAGLLISGLPISIRIPSNELLNEFFNFIKSDEVKKNRNTYVASVLAFSKLLEKSVVDLKHSRQYYPTRIFDIIDIENEELLLNEVLPYFANELEKSVQKQSSKDILLYLRVIGNIGHPSILVPFNEQLQNDVKLTEFQRVALVVALDKLVKNFPSIARTVLYRIYFNFAENPQARCAALLNLILTKPSASMLQHMAQSTTMDPSEHVQSCTKSAIETAANLKLSENSELAKNAESARKFLNSRIYAKHYSRSNFKDYFINNLKLSNNIQYSKFIRPENIYPNAILYSEENYNNGYITNSFEFNAMVSSISKVIAFLRVQFGENINNISSNRKIRAEDKWSSKWTNKYVDEHLNIQPYYDEDFEGQFYLNAMGFDNFISFDKNILINGPQLLAIALQNGINLNFNKFTIHQPVRIGFPLAAGHPFSFTYSKPSLVQANGKVKVKFFDKKEHLLQTINITATTNLLYSESRLARVGFTVPSTAQRYMAGYNKMAQINLPYNFELDFSSQESSIHGKISYIEPRKDLVLVHGSSLPYTVRKDIDDFIPDLNAEDVKIIHSRKQKGFKICTNKNITGNVYCVDAQYEWPSGDLQELKRILLEKDFYAIGKLQLPFGRNDFYHINLLHSGSESTTNSLRFSFKYDEKFFHGLNQLKNGRNKKNLDFVESFDTSPDSEERRKEFLENSVYGIRDAKSMVIDASIVFDGAEHSEFVFTAVHANSEIDENVQHIYFVSIVPVQKEYKKQLCGFGFGKIPKNPALNFEDAMLANITSYGNFELVLGETCSLDSTYYNGTFKLNQDEKYKREIRDGPVAQHCRQEMQNGHPQAPACVNATYYANLFNHIEISVNYENPSIYFRNLTDFIHSYLQYKYYQHNEIEHNNNSSEENLIKFEFHINPNSNSLNATIQTSDIYERFIEVPRDELTKKLFQLHVGHNLDDEIFWNLYGEQHRCYVDSNRIRSFDNATTFQHFGKCWYALAHYVEPQWSEKYAHLNRLDAFSVLIQGDKSNGHGKDILIIFPQSIGHDHVIRLSPGNSGSMIAKAIVNGKEHEIFTGQTVIEYDSDKNPTEDLPAFSVVGYNNLVTVFIRDKKVIIYYNKDSVRLEAKKLYFNDVRGVCGNYNGEKYDDRLSPRNCAFEKSHYFAPSWSIADDECSEEVKHLKDESHTAVCSKHYYVHSILLEPKNLSNSKSHNLHKRMKYDSNSDLPVSTSENSSDEDVPVNSYHSENNNEYPEMKIQYIQRGNKLCFTKKELPVCPGNCNSSNTEMRRVDVHCRDVNDSVAQLYKQQIDKGVKIDLSAKETTKMLTFKVPRNL